LKYDLRDNERCFSKNICKKRILILTGAGFTIPFGCPNTENLTNLFRTNNVSHLGSPLIIGGSLAAGEYLLRGLCSFYSNNTRTSDCNPSEVNFETIIYFLEEVYSFLVSQHQHQRYIKFQENILNNPILTQKSRTRPF
jgi:hypothetical protein